MPRRVRISGVGRVALLPPAAFLVHQLRYELAYGSHTGRELRETGHSYLHSVVPWLVALVGLSAGLFLLRVGRALAQRRTPRERSTSFAMLWAACALALVAVFACQETLEGIFATGHPAGWTGVFGDGGWWSIPVAMGVGLILAALFRGAHWAVSRIATRRRARPVTSRRPVLVRRPTCAFVAGPAPLLDGWSSRGPPA